MTKVTPLLTATGPMRLYGRLDAVQIVSELRIPTTSAAATVENIELAIMKPVRRTIANAVESDFVIRYTRMTSVCSTILYFV